VTAPRIETIPQELKDRAQWIVWRLVDKRNGKKPKKKPYTADASAPPFACDYTDPANWRSFDEAVAYYHSRSGYFAGIGYVFAADDPFVGGDIDHDLSTDRLPATYAEVSYSGDGTHFIARATGTYVRKTKRGELYSHSRFFAITGNVLPGHEHITEQQEAVETFYRSLGGTERSAERTVRDGTPGNGSRAELASAISEDEWAEGRNLLRTQGDRLVERAKRAAGNGTQLDLILREDFATFDRNWSCVGIYRADGTLDSSQVRAVAARGIYGRGFTFAEYTAIMSRLYAADALEKWGSKELWRQELAALWAYAGEKSPTPKIWQPTAPAARQSRRKEHSVLRGRAGNHADLVERVYQQLRDRCADEQAIVKCGELAGVIGCARETISRVIKELITAQRIKTHQLPRAGGLAVTFLGVIYSAEQAPVCAAPMPEMAIEPLAPIEETRSQTVFLPDREADHISPAPAEPVPEPQAPPADEAQPPVLLPAEPPTLAEAVKEAFDAYQERPRTVRRKGRLCRAPLTRKRIAAYVEGAYPALGFSDAELDQAVDQERRDRKLADLSTMKPSTLRAEIRAAEARADASRRQGTNAWRWWVFFASKAQQELASRPADTKRPKGGYLPCEALPNPRDVAAALQAEMWGIIDDDASRRPLPARTATVTRIDRPDPEPPILIESEPPQVGTEASLLRALFDRQAARAAPPPGGAD
jgi:hypothetical protein